MGFSATHYKWTDSRSITHDVLSYRGTDLNSSNLPEFDDVWNGWIIGAGFSGASQAALAVKFYDAVLNPDPDEIAVTANVELVGHSLGGGLAGFVASHSGGEAYVYDHMPFGLASWAQTIGEALDNAATANNVSVADAIAVLGLAASNPLTLIGGAITAAQFLTSFVSELNSLQPDFSHIHATSVQGEILSFVRDGSLQELAGDISGIVGAELGAPVLGALLVAAGLFEGLTTSELESQIPDISELSLFGMTLNGENAFQQSVNAHSIALLAILEYFDKQWTSDAKLMKVNPLITFDFLPALQDEGIATSLGLVQGQTGAWSAGSQLAGIIAYSAIDVGERPFGDTGIRAIFGDASDLARSTYGFSVSTKLIEASADLGKLSVEFGGLLARNYVLQSDDPTAVKGVLQYMKATATRAETLAVDLRESTWTKGEVVHVPSVREALLGDVLGNIAPTTLAEMQEWYSADVSGVVGLSQDVNQIVFALSPGLAPGALAGTALTGLSVSVLGNFSGSVNVGSGNDLVIGSTGNDIIYGGGKSDILIGGFADDELHGGDGKDLLIAGGGFDVLYGDDGADTFIFDGTDQWARFIGGKGNDIYDLRGSNNYAEIVINRGDGRDTLKTDSDSFDFGTLKFTADGNIPDAPITPISVYLPDRTLGDVKIVWNAIVSDTLNTDDGKIELMHGHIQIRDNSTNALIFDMGEQVGTKQTYNNYPGYEHYELSVAIHFHDAGVGSSHLNDFRSIGDGIWPGLIVI